MRMVSFCGSRAASSGQVGEASAATGEVAAEPQQQLYRRHDELLSRLERNNQEIARLPKRGIALQRRLQRGERYKDELALVTGQLENLQLRQLMPHEGLAMAFAGLMLCTYAGSEAQLRRLPPPLQQWLQTLPPNGWPLLRSSPARNALLGAYGGLMIGCRLVYRPVALGRFVLGLVQATLLAAMGICTVAGIWLHDREQDAASCLPMRLACALAQSPGTAGPVAAAADASPCRMGAWEAGLLVGARQLADVYTLLVPLVIGWHHGYRLGEKGAQRLRAWCRRFEIPRQQAGVAAPAIDAPATPAGRPTIILQPPSLLAPGVATPRGQALPQAPQRRRHGPKAPCEAARQAVQAAAAMRSGNLFGPSGTDAPQVATLCEALEALGQARFGPGALRNSLRNLGQPLAEAGACGLEYAKIWAKACKSSDSRIGTALRLASTIKLNVMLRNASLEDGIAAVGAG